MPFPRRRRSTLRIESAAPGVGVIAEGVDVNHLSGDEWCLLYRAWLNHNVLVVRGQDLAIEQFLAYSRRFGRLQPHHARRARHAQFPELTVVGDDPPKTEGHGWHTDRPWDTEVVKATQLYAVEIPSVGGDTLFADMYAAYDALPESLKRRIEGLEAEFVYGRRTRHGIGFLDPGDPAQPPAVHPVARLHAETGRKSLYVNPTHIQRIVGLAPGGYPVGERRVHWRVTIMEDAAQGANLTRAA